MGNGEVTSDAFEPAGIEYHGIAGATKPCIEAVERLLVCNEPLSAARILTHETHHALVLTLGEYDQVAIKSGFGSGYFGEGSRGFSYVLQLLEAHHVPLEEHEVSKEFMARLDHSALSQADLEELDAMSPVRPKRLYEYIWDRHDESARDGALWQWQSSQLPMPFPLLDPRIMDLAIDFWMDPDRHLITAYRRLEDLVRERTGIDERGSNLFSKAFLNEGRCLTWPGVHSSERDSRALLFVSAFRAFRNPRAHGEMKDSAHQQMLELFLINILYQLERNARAVEASIDA